MYLFVCRVVYEKQKEIKKERLENEEIKRRSTLLIERLRESVREWG